MRLLVPEWFADTDEGPALQGWKCGECGKVTFPRKLICPRCAADGLEQVNLSSRGILHTFTETVLAGAAGPATPYVIGFVDLPEGIRLISLIVDCSPWQEKLRVDMEVEMTVGHLRNDPDGQSVHSYLFRPVTEGPGERAEVA